MVDERNSCVKDVRCDMVCFEATESAHARHRRVSSPLL